MQPYERDKSIGPRESQTTLIGNLFGGYLQSQVKCHECNYESNTYDPFMDLSLEINTIDSLTRAFTKFVKPEILDARNMYLCPRCKKRVRAQKQMRVYQAPPVLTIQLKRFSFEHMYGGKISRPVKYDQHLTLDPYMTKKSAVGHEVLYCNRWYRLGV
jgi:ubiquitin C-terminal hydrolase